MTMFPALVFNIIVTFKLYTFFTKKIHLLHKYSYPLHIMFTLLVVFLHLIYFIKTHDKNYFELIGINRLFTEEELNQAYRSKLERLQEEVGLIPQTQGKIEKLNKIYEVLNHGTFLQIYDKYGKEESNQKDLFFNALNFATIMQNLMQYLITLIIINLVTKDEHIKGCRKWIAAVMMMFFSNEINMYLGKRENFDFFFDNHFSQFAIFDRIEIIRFLMIPCLLAIRLNFILFNKTTFVKVSNQIRETLKNHEEISKQIKSKKIQEYDNTLKKIRSDINNSLEKIEGEQNSLKEKEIKKKTCWTYCYKIIIYLIIAFIILSFFTETKFEVNNPYIKYDQDE